MVGYASKTAILLSLTTLSFVMIGCASSNVTRDAASNIDVGVENIRNITNGGADFGDSYQNTSQAVKGGLIGGAIGAIAGTVSTSIGFIPGTAAGIILGASYGSYVDSQTSLSDKLENRGVQIVILGDQIMIVMPSGRIFDALSSTIKPASYSTLMMVAQFINQYNKTLVKISAYTNQSNSATADAALSAQQAIAIERFLIASGVDARVIYAAGYGGTNLVQPNDMVWFGNDNYRIQITFEKLYA